MLFLAIELKVNEPLFLLTLNMALIQIHKVLFNPKDAVADQLLIVGRQLLALHHVFSHVDKILVFFNMRGELLDLGVESSDSGN